MSKPRNNPYVGPRAFQTGEKLFGRDREIRELLNLIIAERIVVLHSPSGAGKSSLIHAGLVPALQAEGFQVLPVVRVNLEPPTSKLPADRFNRYVYSAMVSLEEPLPDDIQRSNEQLIGLTFNEYLDQRPHPQDDSKRLVLIFDQFEEILTVDPTDQEDKLEFFRQVGSALLDRNRWAIFSLREDFLAALAPYVRPVPTRFSNTFRLDLLGKDAARQAIQKPAKAEGVEFQDDAAIKLVDDLRKILVQNPDGSMREQLGIYVEPVQLQVVCYRLWSQLPQEETHISKQHLASVGDVNQSLADYYAERLSAIAEESGVSERLIRDWIEDKLITEGGFRSQVLMGEGKSEGLDNNIIRQLENYRLVRAEVRRGATWFELSHDRLIEPVRINNALWSQTNLTILQRQAKLWEQQDRSDTLFLRDDALVEAEQWAAAHPDELSDVDQEFLKACLEQRAREEAARAAAERERLLKLEAAEKIAESERLRAEEQSKAATRLRRRAYILALVMVIALIMAGLAFRAQQQANDNFDLANRQRAIAEEASTAAVRNENQAIDSAATAEAAESDARQNAEIARENAATAQAASTRAVAQQVTAEYNAQVAQQQANLARSRELASLALGFLKQDSAVTLLLGKEALEIADTGQALDTLLRGLQRNLSRRAEVYDQTIPRQEFDIYSLDSSPDGTKIAWAGAIGLIRMWDLETQEQISFVPLSQGVTVYAISFSPDGSALAAGDSRGFITFWDSKTLRKIRNIQTPLQEIYSLEFSPDGSTLAFAGRGVGANPNVYTRELETGVLKGFRVEGGSVLNVLALAWSPDGKLLASGGRDQMIRIWEVETGLEKFQLMDFEVNDQLTRIFEGPIRSLEFSPNGKWLATGAEDNRGDRDRSLMVWDTSLWSEQEPLVFQAPTENLTVLKFSPDGQTLASGYQNGEVILWNFNSQEINALLKDHSTQVRGLDFNQFEDSLLLASAELNRSIVINNLIAGDSLYLPISENKGASPRLAVGLSNNLVSIGDLSGNLTQWELDESGNVLSENDLGVPVSEGKYSLSPDGSRFAWANEEGQVQIQGVDGDVLSVINLPPADFIRTDADGQVTQSQQAGVIDSLALNFTGDRLAGGMCVEYKVIVDPETRQQSQSCVQNMIQLWDATTGTLIKTIPSNQNSAILSLAFDPQDENALVTGYQNSVIQIWDLEQSKAIGLPLPGAGGPITSLAFNQDGDILATGSDNNLVALWNVNPLQLIGDPMVGADGSITGLAFGLENSRLYSASELGTILGWDLANWKNLACKLAERNLTAREWEQFFPGEDRRATCEETPLETSEPTMTTTPTP